MSPMAEWLAYYPFNSHFPGSSRVGHYYTFQKINLLKGHCNVHANSRLDCDYMVTE